MAAFKVLTRARVCGVLPKCLGTMLRTTPPRMQHIAADAISAASTASKIVAVKPTVSSSIDIGYRAYSSGFFTLNPNTMIFYVKTLCKMLDSAYGAEFLGVISLIWKYTPVMLLVERALSAGEMKVGSAKMAEINEKIEKLPEVTVKHLILQMDRLGMKEVLKVTGLDKKKAEFENNMSEFEKNEFEKNRLKLGTEFNFEKYICEKPLSKLELDGNQFEEPYAVPIVISSTRVNLFRKKLSVFEKCVSTFELDGNKFEEPCAETMRDYFGADGEKLYIELDPQDIDVVELTKSLGAETIIIIPIRGKLVRKKFGAASIGNNDGEDANESNDDLHVKKEDKDDGEEGRKAT